MKQESPGNIKSLRWYHAAIIVLSALGALAVLFVDNWSEMIWLLPIAVATCFDGKFEKIRRACETKHFESKYNYDVGFICRTLRIFHARKISRDLSSARIGRDVFSLCAPQHSVYNF